MKTFNSRFYEFIKKHGLLKTSHIVIAFSGGKDSVTLFHLLKELQQTRKFRLTGAYLNHNLRKDSQTEEEWVTQFFKSHSTDLVKRSLKIAGLAEKRGMNLEHTASVERYRFFSEISKRNGATVVTAHTKSDITETFLIKLFRGSGTQGLTSIHMIKDNYLQRPLLPFTQEEITEYLKSSGLSHYQDSSNLKSDFLRNRIRNEIVPQLKEINPLLDDALNRTSDILKEEYRYMSNEAMEFLKKELINRNILPLNRVNSAPLALRRHIVREYIRIVKGDLLNIGYDHIEAVIESMKSGDSVPVPGVTLASDSLHLFPFDTDIPEWELTVEKEDTVSVPEAGLLIKTSVKDNIVKDRDNSTVTLPLDKLEFPLKVRSPLKSDKYRKVNTDFNQKVYEMIRSAGISKQLRNLCPVFFSGDTPVWAYRCPVAAEFYIEENNKPPYLTITVENCHFFNT